MYEPKWQDVARHAAHTADGELFEAHRGAFEWNWLATVLFDNRFKAEHFIPRIVARCEAEGILVLATCEEPTCVVVVESGDVEVLNELVWEEWANTLTPDELSRSGAFYNCQRDIADDVLAEYADACEA